MSGTEQILLDFETYLLDDQNGNSLMNRYDTKYIFHRSSLSDILQKAKDSYKRLDISRSLIPVYESIYYDTSDFKMYLSHHNKKLNRYKIRIRSYKNTDVHYLEVKYKNNKKITEKVRIKTNNILSFSNDTGEKEFLETNTPYSFNDLVKSLTTKFGRITLSDFNFRERITIDVNLELTFNNNTEMFEDIVICEVKKPNKYEYSKFESILNQQRIKPFGLSKYCLGQYYLNKDVKHNMYKEKVILLNKKLQSNE